MNERIKILCQEAFTEAHESRIGPDGLVRSDGNPYIFYEQFAELIVKECLTFCEYQGDRFDEYDSGMTERARIIRESIQEHFGVTE